MCMTTPPRKPRTRPLFKALGVILLSLPLLYYGFCSPLDVTDDPAGNGGYTRNALYIVQQPMRLVRYEGGDALSPASARPLEAGSEALVPAGTHLQLLYVSYSRMVMVDNAIHSTSYARILDGSCAGKTVSLRYVSLPGHGRPPHHAQINPAYLSPFPEPAFSAPTSQPTR